MKLAIHIAIAMAAMPACGHAQIFSGPVRVIDGDSFDMSGVRIRLFGIDAPEIHQTCQREGAVWQCGDEAADMMRALVRADEVSCEKRDRDVHGRTVAVCTIGTVDLAQTMIEAGLAVALPRFTDAYIEREAQARSLKLGLWGSDFQLPSEYRAQHQGMVTPRNSAVSHQPTTRAFDTHKGGCTIKGNRNRKGQWIYHLPGMPYYDVTRAEEIFCTEAQARAAGYRRAIVK